MHKLFEQLSEAGKPAILSIVPGFASAYIPLVEKGELPKPLTDLFQEEYLKLPYTELTEKSDEVMSQVQLTYNQCKAIEKHTRQQCFSKMWFQQRAGCITASRLKQAVRTNPDNPSQSLIWSICYPENSQFVTKATAYGCRHEKDAKETYISKTKDKHTNFHVSRSGLVVDPNYPFFGASPDGLIRCDCCGTGVLEIKCPFTCKDKSFLLKSKESSSFCLKTNDDQGLTIDTTRTYYYQIQAQMKFSGANYCDFVVWSDREVLIERIHPDNDFITSVLEKAMLLVKYGIVPELAGKWFSRAPNFVEHVLGTNDSTSSDTEQQLWCYCKGGEFGEMIACEDEFCPITWFHTNSLKMEQIPQGAWYCSDCTKNQDDIAM